MFGFHAPELIIVLVVALLIFGPKKLPEMGSAIGKSIREFQKGMKEVTSPKEDSMEEPQLPESLKTNNFTSTSTTTPEGEVVTRTTSSETETTKSRVE
jgi:sec-independent protein translocase protein TatA